MPAKRKASKQRDHRITPEAVQTYQTAKDHADIYQGCINGVRCRTTDQSRHCEECALYLEASRQLHHFLGLKPWEQSPIRVSDDPPPPDPSSPWVESWQKAKALHDELEAAAAEQFDKGDDR